MRIKLRITKPGDTSFDNEVIVEEEAFTLGRRVDNRVVLDDREKQVSGRHAKIEWKGGTWIATDLGSLNHTYLDGTQLEPERPVTLRNGSMLQIGMLQVEVVLDESAGEDLSKTIVRTDPKRTAAVLGDRLCEAYAEHRESSPEARTRALRAVVGGVLDESGPEQARAVLGVVLRQFGAGAAAGTAAGAAGEPEGQLGAQEALYRVGFESARDMSRHFVGPSPFGSAEELARFTRLIQQTLDVMLDWVARALKGRAEFKEEFGAELTRMFYPKQQNPLKAGGGPEDIGRFLLDWTKERNLAEARTSLEEALNDLSMHQLSLLQAVQKTLKQVFDQLDPEKLEAEAKSKEVGLLQKIGIGGESPWDIYKQAFAQMRDEKSKFFDGVIFPTMQNAYVQAHKQILDAEKKRGDTRNLDDEL